MKAPPPPLRFLCLVLGGWVCLRASILASGWWEERAVASRTSAPDRPFAPTAAASPAPPRTRGANEATTETEIGKEAVQYRRSPDAFDSAAFLLAASPDNGDMADFRAHDLFTPAAAPPALAAPLALAPPTPAPGRWSASAWLFMREGPQALAPGGTLGGSQAGGRISFRLNGNDKRPFALSVRAYAPLDDPGSAEAAFGIDWRPLAGLPLHLLAERRQALGGSGRSAFALTVYGGVSDREAGPLRLDAYAQTGMVGARSRDLFADGSARLSLPVGKAKIGGGLWGAAQPGVARLDIGPQTSFRLPAGDGAVTLAADWRFRIAGDAAPAAGPALTLSAEF